MTLEPKTVGELLVFLKGLPEETVLVERSPGATCRMRENTTNLHFIGRFESRTELDPVVDETLYYGKPVLFVYR